MRFISKSAIPHNRNVVYTWIVCNYRYLKDKMHRVGIIVGSYKLLYLNDTSSLAADFLEAKLILNSTISDC